MSWIYIEPGPAPEVIVDALAGLAVASRRAAEALGAMNVPVGPASELERRLRERGIPRSSGSAGADQLRCAGPGFEVRMPGMDLDEPE